MVISMMKTALILNVMSGPATSTFSTDDKSMPMAISSAGEGGTAVLSLDGGMFRLHSEMGALDYTVTPDMSVMPLPPFNASIASGMMELQVPVAPSEDFRDVAVGLKFNGLTLGDTVWGMFDPDGKLPRDPANLELDLDARMQLNEDLSDAPSAGSPMNVGEVESVDLNSLLLSAAGALITAKGAVTMDNSGPVPMPNGAVDINVEGVQTLTQKLVDLGLIPQMYVGVVMGAIMGFSKPVGDDAFTSKIEFKDGSILANGQQIQ